MNTGSQTSEAPEEYSGWMSIPERGTVLGIRILFWFANRLGRRAVRAVVAFVALYYVIADRKIRQTSREWWLRVTGREPSFWKIYGHVRRFANVSTDRIFLLSERCDLFQITCDGAEYLERLEKLRQGAILLGAHLGSFEAMRLRARYESLTINIVGNFSNAQMINTVLREVSINNVARVITVTPDDVSYIFDIQKRISQGEMVAILGDRVEESQSFVQARFFGHTARFAAGPFQLAAILKCPIYLTFGVFEEPNIYRLFCRPFMHRLDLPRKNREQALRDVVQKYADALEVIAREYPDNWFNFFHFWEK